MINQKLHHSESVLSQQFARKLEFYESCLSITYQLKESLDADDEELVLQLLKRRDIIFHRIRRLDSEIGNLPADDERIRQVYRQSPRLKSLINQIEQVIYQIMQLDAQIHLEIGDKHTKARNKVGRTQQQQKIARSYRMAGAKPPPQLDLNE